MNTDDHILDLMSRALEDALGAQESAELQRHLAGNPEVARQWHSLLFIESLLRTTPPVPVPANFAARTLARLPSPRLRLAWFGFFWFALMLGGLLPLAALLWLAGSAGFSPALVGGIVQEMVAVLQLIGAAVFSALTFLSREQPWLMAGLVLPLLLVAGWVMLWQELTSSPTPVLLNRR
jgi:anti-sigma factor RsiW